MASLNPARLLRVLSGTPERRGGGLSSVDPVTRLPARDAAMEELKRCLARSRHKQPVGLAIVDFRSTGMAGVAGAGEPQVLRRLSRLLRAHVPPEHFLGHLRDREFAVIVCGLAVADVERIVDHVIQSVRQADSLQAERRYIATMVGIGYSSRAGCTASELLRLADIALHYAQAAGRSVHTIVDRVPRSLAA